MKETCILLRNQTEFPKMSNNSKNTGVEFAEHGSTWTQFLNHVFTIFHGMDLLLNARSKRMPAKVRFRSLTLDQQVSSVVSAFKQKLGMVNWSTLAATLGVCYCAVRPLCHLLRLITEMAPTSLLCYYFSLFTYCWSCSEVQVSSNHLNYLQKYQGTLSQWNWVLRLPSWKSCGFMETRRPKDCIYR